MFKINISDKGKTLKIETESEVPIGKAIGETIKGEDISVDLDGYELEITGTSDLSGFPGKKGLEGAGYHRVLLKKGFAMKNTKKGLRLRKTLRGQEISSKTSQINTKIIKQGTKKFEDLFAKEEAKEEKPTETQTTDNSSEKLTKDTIKETENKKEEPAEKQEAKPIIKEKVE